MNYETKVEPRAGWERDVEVVSAVARKEEREFGHVSQSTKRRFEALCEEFLEAGRNPGRGEKRASFDISEGAKSISAMIQSIRNGLGGEKTSGGASMAAKTIDTVETIGDQFVKCAGYEAFVSKKSNYAKLQAKNTLVGSDTTVAPARRPGGFGALAWRASLEGLIPGFQTESSIVEFTRETASTNSAAERAQGVAAAESSVSISLETAPVQTVAHFLKVSRQLVVDAPRFAEWINSVLLVGLDRRVEAQLIGGAGVDPNLAGLNLAGNFTAHGYTAAGLGAIHQRVELIRRVIEDIELAGESADGVILNPADWSTIERLKDGQNLYLGEPFAGGPGLLWKVPVISSSAMPADKFLVAPFRTSAEIHNREGPAIRVSDEDGSNFREGLVTVLAVRRVALAVTRPASIRGGDLTPA